MLHELINGNPVTMSSREIAELCGKEHRNVLRDIRAYVGAVLQMERGIEVTSLDWEGVGGVALFEQTPIGGVSAHFETNEQNGQSYPVYDLDKIATLTVIAGYNILLRKRIIERWQALELKAAGVPATYPEALRLAATFADDLNKAHAALAVAAPKAAALDRIATETEGAVCLRVAAKLLQIPERKFLKFAHAKGFIFRGSHNTWIAYSEKVKAGLMELKLTKIRCTDGSERRVEQVLFTRSGLAKMAELLAKAEMKPLEVRRA